MPSRSSEGLPVVASYLVEHKKGRIESITAVLARVFTPLLLVVLLGLLVSFLITGRAPDQDRELLFWFDLLLLLVLGTTLYGISARDSKGRAGPWDMMVFALLVVALIVDGVALVGVASRPADYGVSPNRLAALGANILLLVNLGFLATGYLRFVLGRAGYQPIVDLQMRYLPTYAVWAALVVVVFPPLFGFR